MGEMGKKEKKNLTILVFSYTTYTPFMYFRVKFNVALNWFLHENKWQRHLPAGYFRYKVTL